MYKVQQNAGGVWITLARASSRTAVQTNPGKSTSRHGETVNAVASRRNCAGYKKTIPAAMAAGIALYRRRRWRLGHPARVAMVLIELSQIAAGFVGCRVASALGDNASVVAAEAGVARSEWVQLSKKLFQGSPP